MTSAKERRNILRRWAKPARTTVNRRSGVTNAGSTATRVTTDDADENGLDPRSGNEDGGGNASLRVAPWRE
jgi:hypothetical protein